MVFKPFKPPLIRKAPESSSDEKGSAAGASGGDHDEATPPAKKQRLGEVTGGDGERKPLEQVKNSESVAEDTSERRKFTTKKNKTWDGDGIITVRDGFVHLNDISGKEMGRVMHRARLEPGVMLSIGNKEVEVDSEIPRKEYLSGKGSSGDSKAPAPAPAAPAPAPKKQFVSFSEMAKAAKANEAKASETKVDKTKTSSKPAVPSGTKVTPGVKKADSGPVFKSNPYKPPLLETTVIPQRLSTPTPRHDPKQAGALVMKRPDSAPKGKQIVDVVVDPLLTKHLRQHQREGVQFLYECVMGLRSFNGEGAILADDMGLGKTLQTITLLWTLLKQNPIYESPPVVKKALIVCPVTLISNWRREFRKWLGNERVGVFVFDDKRKRLTDFTMGKAYSVMIVGYEKLRTVQEALTRGSGVDIVIADEGHRLKTLQNKSGQAIQSLNTAKRVILSGTPIQNDLREFFAAIDLINPGVLGTFKAFVRDFEGPIVRSSQPEATKKDIEKGEARGEELRELTSQFMLRRTADILAKYLPPKSEYVLFCSPTPSQANFYRHVLASPVFQSVLGSSESALQLITILKKICNSPSLLTAKSTGTGTSTGDNPNDTVTALLSTIPPKLQRLASTPGMSAKIRVLDQLLHNLHTNTSEKIVLVSNYTSTLDLLARLLSSLSLPFLRLDGSTPTQKRQTLVEDFNRLPAHTCFAFLLSAKAGGTGLNLIGASRLVLFDVDWNPATDVQAMARIHRDGQKRHCRIYRFLLKGSLEEKIWQRQVTKIGLADSVMEHKDNVAQFSRDELRDLFRLDEESKCQTHDLLGCSCGGWGTPGVSTSDTTPTKEDETGNKDSENDDLPDLPALIQASKVNMEEQERQIKALRNRSRTQSRKTSTKSKSKSKSKSDSDDEDDDYDEDEDVDEDEDEPINQKDKMHQSLSFYAHLDPSLLSEEAIEESDKTDRAEKLRSALDDDEGLWALVREEDNRIGFVFKKGQVEPVVDDPSASSSSPSADVRAKTGSETGIDKGLPIVLD